MSDREILERKQIKAALRAEGMSNRQINGLLRGGYKLLIGETEAENAELQEQLQDLIQKIKVKT